MSKIQISESNSQPSITTAYWSLCCWLCQRYKFLKAIHNSVGMIGTVRSLLIMSKIQISESNSQHIIAFFGKLFCCWLCQRYKFLKAIHNGKSIGQLKKDVVDYVKDTNFWKQFTTYVDSLALIKLLLIMSKIQISESNSQLWSNNLMINYSCWLCQRYKFLKAIHNSKTTVTIGGDVVDYVKDTNFWKQFTTVWNWTNCA